jgi:hypothetical protein
MKIVLYEDSPKYDLWLKIVLAFVPSLFIVLALLIYYGVLPAESQEEARIALAVLFATAIFILLLYWAILPKKYQILEDRIRISNFLGKPFPFDIIGFNTIEETRRAEDKRGLTWGINSITSIKKKNIIVIVRSKGMDVTISPSNRELFLQELNKAIANWKRSEGYHKADKIAG